jgi:hypothetical protein
MENLPLDFWDALLQKDYLRDSHWRKLGETCKFMYNIFQYLLSNEHYPSTRTIHIPEDIRGEYKIRKIDIDIYNIYQYLLFSSRRSCHIYPLLRDIDIRTYDISKIEFIYPKYNTGIKKHSNPQISKMSEAQNKVDKDKIFTAERIIKTKEKYPDNPFFKIDDKKKVRDAKKNDKILSYYIPIVCLTLEGDYRPMKFSFLKQVIASGAKPQYNKTFKESKEVSISFKLLDLNDLKESDYREEYKSELIESNHLFIKALDVLESEYIKFCKKELFAEFKKQERR